ncbi:MAG: RNA 2',3'-cyclic phosphodiesterase [Blastomonas sp.]
MRLFLALVPPAAVRARLTLLQAGLPGARWLDAAQMHVTMRFIGNADSHVADSLVAALDRIEHEAVTVRLDGLGHFSRRVHIDQLWAGLSPRAPLAHLHGVLERICVRCGLEPEHRAFVPHITIARFARSAAPSETRLAAYLAAHGGLAGEEFIMDRLFLMESRMGKGGSHYLPLADFGLFSSRR